MDEALAIAAVAAMTVAKVGLFAAAVRRALRPRVPVSGWGDDGPDDGWRWWDEFEPDPQPPAPDRTGDRQRTPVAPA